MGLFFELNLKYKLKMERSTEENGSKIVSNSFNSKMYVEENMVRIVAAEVVVITAVTLATQYYVLAILLGVDFAIRSFTYLPSPLALAAKTIKARFGIKSIPIFAAPKKFAAGIGAVFSFAIFILFYLGLDVAAHAVGGILIFCAVLESGFKICIGCYVYNWLVAPLKNSSFSK
ncbi:MAG: hypothetical protein BGO32_04860 [Bacteroidetes bacterium 37-13]|nr:MAG: hypothetical protein BGO32_04860 [Bacteroidetes bacterium 37-13]